MNIEDLKADWQNVNQKIDATKRVNDQIIISMLRERSGSRITKVRRDAALYLLLMVVNLALFTAIFIGNPFDFEYPLQYVPYGMLAVGVLIAIASLISSLKNFNVNVNRVPIESFLKKIIAVYEKNKKAELWFRSIIFLGGLFTVFSFLPKKLEHQELWPALGQTGLITLITLIVYFVAVKLGVFKNKKREGFENDLNEWNELKSISSDLGNRN